MTRQQKATALAAIRNGKLKPSDLLPPSNFVFYHVADGYRHNDAVMTPEQYQQFAATFKAEAARRELAGLPAGYFITVEYTRRKR